MAGDAGMSFLARHANNGALAGLSVVDRASAEDSGDGTASIEYKPDGRLLFSWAANSAWASPGGPHAEGNLWIRLSGVTGSGGTFTGPAVGSWHQMNVDRKWTLTASGVTVSRNGTISIATDSGGANIIETHSFLLTALFTG